MTYDQLKQAVQDYLESAEQTMLDNFDLFVQKVENVIYNSVELPSNRKNMRGSVDAGSQYLTVPADYLSLFSIAVIDDQTNEYTYLMLKDVNLLREAYPNPNDRATPKYVATFDNDSLMLAPTPDKAYSVELHYHFYPVSLTVSQAGTWVSKNFSSVMLYGVLAEGYRFQKGDAAQQAVYDNQYREALSLLIRHGTARVRTDAYANNQVKPSTPVGE